MKVLIVAKTRQGGAACIGGITLEGRSVRLVAIDAASNERAGMAYQVGEVWEVEAAPAAELIPPHVENVIVRQGRRLGVMSTPAEFIRQHMPPHPGGLEALFEGLTQATSGGALYVTERTGTPLYSTMFWQPDQLLRRDDDGKRIRYRYPTPDGGRTLTFVGFQDPIEVLPAGALLRVSLAHWWRPQEMSDGELRCYVQLSGWYLDGTEALVEDDPVQVARPTSAPTPAEQGQSTLATPPQRLLKSVFGYDSFLPLQEEVIDNLLAGRDTLAIMPTGSGKSLCFQLPALLFDGLTVVVSPLIALMQDQVDALQELGVAAAFLNSSLDYEEYVRTTARVRAGQIRLLYTSPETLLRPETLVLLDQSRVACLVIDEAHCISAWGHDFRPEYRQLLPLRQRYAGAVCLALTATATPHVQEDIASILGFGAANKFIASFNRANLYLNVEPRLDGLQQVLSFLDAHRGQSGIIYCSTRRQVESLAAALQTQGWPALPYHAGLTTDVRLQHQRQFTRDDVPIMVATVAFGMGIDKSNVRFVLHYNLPSNLESYYQEIGRAGRDGLRSDCLLLFNQSDVGTIYHFIEEGAESERPGRQARLDALLRYVQARRCRREPLLAYFGERLAAGRCDMCDNCLAGESEQGEQVDVTIAAQKFLSCVKRTGELFGPAHVIKVLRGSQSKDVLQRGHDRLSTYGIGSEYSARDWRRLAQAFIDQGLLEQDLQFGGLKLTPASYAVFKGEKVYVAAETEGRYAAAVPVSYDTVLFEKLRGLRKRLADASNVPPFVVFSDRSLVEMATYYPQSESALLAIQGVGQRKLQVYGAVFLDLLRSYCAEHGLAERPRAGPASGYRSLGGTRRYQEIGAAYQAGRSIAELQALYNIQRSTVLNHLSQYAAEDNPLDPERLLQESQLDPAQRRQVLAAFAELGPQRLRPVFDALGESVSFEELHLMRLYYLNQSPLPAS